MNRPPIWVPGQPEGAISSSAKTVDRIYEDLRRRIVGFDLPPDMTLSRNELTEHYGVSQAPLREALQRLNQEGLVRIYPQSRTVVTRINASHIYEAHFLRVAIECEVARGLALRPDAGSIARARSIIRMQEAVAESADQGAMFQELDEAFHSTLFSGLGRGGLHRLIREQSGHLERARRLHNAQSRVALIIAGHNSVINAIQSGDSDQAMAAMREHLGGTISHIETLRASYPDYFD
jgi:DNA-binding GntR family transcriptional regulator